MSRHVYRIEEFTLPGRQGAPDCDPRGEQGEWTGIEADDPGEALEKALENEQWESDPISAIESALFLVTDENGDERLLTAEGELRLHVYCWDAAGAKVCRTHQRTYVPEGTVCATCGKVIMPQEPNLHSYADQYAVLTPDGVKGVTVHSDPNCKPREAP